MLGSTAICSTVFLVSSPSGLLAGLSLLEFDSCLSALIAAEGLRGMTRRKKSIARLQ
jgi:hypothetical protein